MTVNPGPSNAPTETKARREHAAELEGPARVQMIIALALGLTLVVIPIYLLQRPRTIGEPIAPAPESSNNPDTADEAVARDAIDAGPTLAISDVKILSCHDATSKKALDACDTPLGLDAIVKGAVAEASSCVGAGNGGGAIVYAVDLNFARKKGGFSVTTPKDGRTLKNPRIAQRCASAVHEKLEAQSLDPIKHEHARYHVSVTATYPGPIE